ncbi:hypothetical protein F5051DRAFT_500426 [Lentinula edodes]|nr:hypothetical protein F5051DRAFT_500426 [Lentinula edodes]
MSTSIAPKRSASPLEDDRPTKAARPPWQELPKTGKADRQLTDSEYQNLKSSLDTERYNLFIFEAAHICMANGSTGKSVVVSQIVSAMGKWLSLLETNYERTVVYLQQWTSMFERERTKISDLSTLFERDISNLHNEVALPAHSNHTPPTNYDQVTRAWNQDYVGSHDKLLLHNMDSSQSPESYGNVAAIVQSSGFGKSRTVDEIAKQVFTIPMNVRNPSATSFGAYPPPDLELHEFLANSRRLVSQTHAFAFFVHLGETVIEFVKQMVKDVYNVPLEKVGRSWWLESCPSLTHSDFATQWREYLSKDIPPQYPLIQDTNPLVDLLYFQEQQGKVRDLLYHMAIQKFKSRGWTNSAPPVGINDAGLRKPYMDLAEIIPPRSVLDLLPKASMNPFKIFFCIDEAHTLTALNGLPSPFIHLRSALSRLYSLAFAVFLSTHSQVAELAGREEIYSASAGSPSIPPFTEMPFDSMSGSNGKLRLSLHSASPSYSSTFFSELETAMSTNTESAATDIAARRLFNLIEKKLTSQKVGEDLIRNVSEMSSTRQLALIDSLLGLFIYPRQAEALSHHLEMIRHHMRTVYTISKNRQIIRSGYPSEPILSSTALSVVRRIDHKYKCDTLAEILSKSDSFLAPDPGQRGEQVAMIILLRAYAATVEEMSSTLAAGQSESFYYGKAVPLLKFLKHLFKTEFHSIFVESRPDNHLEGEIFEQAFKDYTVRFNHFVRAENSSVMTAEAAFVMYLRCAAVMGSAHNKEFDIMIPAVYSKGNDPLNSKKVTAILVSLKRIPFSGKVIIHPIDERVIPFFRPFGRKSAVKRLRISLTVPYISLAMNLAAPYTQPRNTQENYFIEKGKTRGKGKGEQKKNGSKATERTMIRNHREYISLAEVRAGDSPIQQSSRSAHREHPRYCIFAYGLSVYSNVDVDEYRSLLQVTDFFADHPREQTMKEVYAMKPFWTAGSSFGFVDMNESFLTAGIDDEYRVDGVHAQTDTSDDETDEGEMDEDEAGEDETGEDEWDKD